MAQLKPSFDFEPFAPAKWCASGHKQTILGHLFPSNAILSHWDAPRIALPDGDQLVGRLSEGINGVTVALFHGLSGSEESSYIKRMATHCQAKGWTVFAGNLRGAGPGRFLARRSYSSNSAGDLAHSFQWLRNRFPRNRLVAIGFSLSGNLVLNLLGQKRSALEWPDFALAVNPPIDLAATSHLISKGWNRLYQYRFVKDLKRDLQARAQEGVLDSIPALASVRTLLEFDELYTAPQGGFPSAQEYYSRCSSFAGLGKIEVPTVVLHARDDPFVALEPFVKASWSNSTHVVLTEQGGHLGYLHQKASLPGNFGRRWLDYFLMQAIVSYLEGT